MKVPAVLAFIVAAATAAPVRKCEALDSTVALY